MDKSKVEGLLFYFTNVAEMDEGIRQQTLEVLNDCYNTIEEQELLAAKKRKSPNKSGVLQIDEETGKVIAEYATQKEALAAIGKEGKSGIGDALNGRTKTHRAYGYIWYFKDEFQEM